MPLSLSRFMLPAQFEESKKGIKKAKGSEANKQLGGDAGSYWCLETAVVLMWWKNRSVSNTDGTEILK